MSELLLPPGIRMPEPIQQKDTAEDIPIEERGRMLPKATGWKILCGVPEATDTFENSKIVKADSFMKSEEQRLTKLIRDVGITPE